MDVQEAEKLIQEAIKHLEEEFAKIQVGRASSTMVEGLLINAYDTTQPLKNIASISIPDPKTIMIQPWDKSVLVQIESAIREASDLGLNPLNDGSVIRLNIPQPTEERRKELVKIAHAKGEEAKVSIRNARQKLHSATQHQLKDKAISEDEAKAIDKELQDHVDLGNKKVDEHVKAKEAEIMTV